MSLSYNFKTDSWEDIYEHVGGLTTEDFLHLKEQIAEMQRLMEAEAECGMFTSFTTGPRAPVAPLPKRGIRLSGAI